jgi:hypothetical protein
MEKEFRKGIFYRAMMTGVFVGICGTLVIMAYDLIFVEYLKFPLSAIINVASLIFSVNLLFVVIGLLYYAFIATSKKGELLYTIVFVLLTAFFIWKAENVTRTEDSVVNNQFRQLLAGIILIVGILATVALPLLYHNKKFEEHVL